MKKGSKVLLILFILIVAVVLTLTLTGDRKSVKLKISDSDIKAVQVVIYDYEPSRISYSYGNADFEGETNPALSAGDVEKLSEYLYELEWDGRKLVSPGEIMRGELPCEKLTIYTGDKTYYLLLTDNGTVYRLSKQPKNTGVHLPAVLSSYKDGKGIFDFFYKMRDDN